MELIDPEAFEPFHAMLVCECCGEKFTVADPCEVHHLRGRWQRQDAPWSMAALKRSCHTANHAGGEPSYEKLLEIVADRVGTTSEAVEETADLYRNMSCKDSDVVNITKIAELSDSAIRLAMPSWKRYMLLREMKKPPKRKRKWPKRKLR